MPKSRTLRDKQNVPEPDTKKGTTDHTKVFKRTKVAHHGGSRRVQHTQQKFKYDEVEPQPPTFHAGIQKNTKVAMQSKAHDMRDLKTDKPNDMKIVNASCDNTYGVPIVKFNGPREAFQMTADALNILDAVLETVEKIPVLKHTTETQQVNRNVNNSLEILNAAIRMNERTATSDNIQEEKEIVLKTVKETEDTDILNYMMKLEGKVTKPKPGYMDKQPEVTGAMRSKQVDWLVHVFKGTNDKLLHMTVYYMDTILSRMAVVKSQLQLLACAAGMVACKTEKVYIQNAEYWVILGGKTFRKPQLLEMERIILSIMRSELVRPTILCFIRHVCYLGKVNAKIVTLANYISELVLLEGDVYLQYSPSLLAIAIIALARHTLGQSDIWPQKLMAVTHHTSQQLLPLFALLRNSFNNAPNNPNYSVYKKYMDKNLLEVAKLKPKQLNPDQIQ